MITTWSVYGLYKLSIGASDTFLGLSFRTTNEQSIETRTSTSNNQLSDTSSSSSSNESTHKISTNRESKPQAAIISQPAESSNHKSLTYSQPNEANQLQNILQQLYSVSRNRENEAGQHQDNIRNQINSFDHLRAQVHDKKLNPTSSSSLDPNNSDDNYKELKRGYKLPSNLEDLLDRQDKRHRIDGLLPAISFNRSNDFKPPPISFPSLMQLGAEAAKANEKNKQLKPKIAERIESKFPDVVPDYNDEAGNSRSSDDSSSYDRTPAESNRDSSESMIKSDDLENQSGSYNNDDSDNQQKDTETTTAQPIYEETDRDKSDGQSGQDDMQTQSPDTNSEPQSGVNSDNGERVRKDNDNDESSRGSDDEASQQPDEETTKETSRSIDEEVDKMTQPTSGMVSQQDRPFDYKNIVQFDDSPPASSNGISKHYQPDRKLALKALEPDDLIARFEDPNRKNNQFKEEAFKQKELPDLQVDHNIESTGIGTSTTSPKRNDHQSKRIRGKYIESIPKDRDNRAKRFVTEIVNRQKRSSVENIRAPYEVGKFLDSLNFDSLTGQSSEINQEPGSSDLNLADSRNHSTTVDRYAYNPITGDETKQSHTNNGRREINRENLTNSTNKIDTIEKRNLFDDELIGPENANKERKLAVSHYYDSDQDMVNNPNQYYRNETTMPSLLRVPDKSRYHYLTSNDTGIQELLDKKSLFDSLSSDDLPPPTEKPDIPTVRPKQLAMSKNQSNKSDHQAEDSLFSVDHGLLLYPSADEEHHHKEKAISKKHKKSDKKKEKKKMTVAIKKGGHKKKKHKKEMKKFLKEKKFKGAKKGKKVAKGKGGQGGKKGKKLYKDKGFKKKGFKNVYHKEEFGQKKSYFDEYRDKDFKKKWKKFDDKYNYAQMKKWQAKDVKAAKKKKDHGEKYKKYDKGKWKKKYEKHSKEHSEKHMKKKKKSHKFR